MLLSMQQLATSAPQSRDRNFADLLAGLALPAKKPPQGDLDGLEDDVATLSYEQALRGRSRSVPPPSPANLSSPKPFVSSSSPETPATVSQPRARRSTSVTVRFSASEADQLHALAAEANMTVSAYLRSCAFEVENLRSEVKSTLAKLRSAPAPEAKPNPIGREPRGRWPRALSRWFKSKSSPSAAQPTRS